MARRRRRNRGRNRQRDDRRAKGLAFWGDVDKLPERTADVRLAEHPDTAIRSLGTPPMPGRDMVAAHYFAAVVERVAGVSGALAAAGGMIDPAALTEQDDDEDR